MSPIIASSRAAGSRAAGAQVEAVTQLQEIAPFLAKAIGCIKVDTQAPAIVHMKDLRMAYVTPFLGNLN